MYLCKPRRNRLRGRKRKFAPICGVFESPGHRKHQQLPASGFVADLERHRVGGGASGGATY